MKFRTYYDGNGDSVSVSTGLVCVRPTLAKQAFKDECDINTIVKRFGLGYEIPSSFRLPSFGDFTGVSTFEDAVNIIATANEQFDMLPAEIRSRFANDPTAFVEFVSNKDNFDDVVKMGLAPAKSAPEAVSVPDGGSPPTSPLQAAQAKPDASPEG